ncbi:DUF6455 family protein [Neorhizobium galegae]|uniref:DUF6455 family protein n=1 Tax=Neorhizobium galegae TaxID=399 RepID=UPI0006214C99|nr:DUF6455 family protein [Neorhizobium galegae]CDZ27658.1 Hypothetical protein NGAL_HAMBI490_25050 [Neorhizobium galegae bv. officinalis]KAA9386653.1 hypothetical protein F4V88_09305 [Neorhizobium galegae]KAB1109094.1 hypothetical protein F4V89_28320 [Neorhizobium galegae]MCM2501453.1 DUF6455 family protein [Neorhizobium galegae]MCQ1772403.1 DUF6455 family protein [Neorhizobium galegae]
MDNTIPTPAPNPENLTHRLKRWCSATWTAINEAKLLASLDDETVKLLAQDNALSAQELRELIAKGPHAADEMLALMKLLNIDPEEARLEEPAEFRDMNITCAHCGEKTRCRRELADGSAASDFASYCGNADVLDDMRNRPELLAK